METVDVVMLVLLPVLLVLSAFFSGSETALFSMGESERMHLRRMQTLPSRAIQALLGDRRMLLITVLLGNMVVNVLYFVLSSVLMMRLDTGVAGGALLAAASLLAIVLLGEVVPKMLANAHRVSFASITGPPLLVLHNLITPIRHVLSSAVVIPLSRLTAPNAAPPLLDENELGALLEISSRQGVIDVHEQQTLQDVFSLRRLRVRDVMTPRVRMDAVRITASRDDVINHVREHRPAHLPVYAGDLDHIAGVLHVKRYLLDPRGEKLRLRQAMSRPRFVPQSARLDQLLDEFRRSKSRVAVVVDEYGGTAGVVTLEDVVERLVGDVAASERREVQPPRMVALNKWQVDGDVSVHDWAAIIAPHRLSTNVSTVGGLVLEQLGRAPAVGDVVTVGNVELEVSEVDGSRISSVLVTLLPLNHREGGERDA